MEILCSCSACNALWSSFLLLITRQTISVFQKLIITLYKRLKSDDQSITLLLFIDNILAKISRLIAEKYWTNLICSPNFLSLIIRFHVSSVTVICMENGIGELSSNSNLLCYVQFCTNVFGKGMNLSLHPHSYRLNSRIDWTLLRVEVNLGQQWLQNHEEGNEKPPDNLSQEVMKIHS